jgi:hypothetical protein
MNKPLLTLATLGLVITCQAPSAADIETGKQLQQKNCMSCHSDAMYTRDDRFIKSLSSLRTQVQRCESTLGLKWFDDEIDAVTDYLNNAFYHFK